MEDFYELKTDENDIEYDKKYYIEKIYFILDYPIGTKIKEYSDFYESKGIIDMKTIDKGIISLNEENSCEYYVFCINLKSTYNKFELKINILINDKINDILIKIPNKNKYIFIFDIEVKGYFDNYIWKVKIWDKYKNRNYSSFLTEIDKLIIFKKALKKNNIEKIQLHQLIEDGLLLFNNKNNKNYIFLLNLFCISQDQKISTKIINMFYKSINIGKRSLFDNEESNIIKNYMEKLEENISFYIDFSSCSKEKVYSFLIYYKILYCSNDINNYINKLYNNNELKTVLLNILWECNEFLCKYLSLTPQLITDLAIKSLNNFDFEGFSISLKYIKDILLYLEIITNNIDKIYQIYYLTNKTLIINGYTIKINKYEIEQICSYINKITEYQKNKKTKFICFSLYFWDIYINDSNIRTIINKKNINNLFLLRNCMNQFLNLKSLLNENKEWDIYVPFDLEIKDEFGNFLHNNIIKIINNKQEEKLSNDEKIELILTKDPYYYEDEYKYKRDHNIFKMINIFQIEKNQVLYNKLDNLFINTEEYNSFIKIIFNQIDNLNKLKKIFKIFDLDNKKEKIISDIFYDKIKQKLQELVRKELFIKNDLSLLSEIILLIIDLIIKKQINKLESFLDILIKELENQFKEDILLKIFEKYKHNNEIKQYINKYLKDVVKEENISTYSFEKLINYLKLLDLNELDNFFNKNINNQAISKEEFYSNKNIGKKIDLFIYLKNNNLYLNNNEYFTKTDSVIKTIYNEITNNEILYSNLNQFLQQRNEIILQKLIVLEISNKEIKIKELKEKMTKINEIIEKLTDIKDNLYIFHRNINKINIENVNNLLKEIKEGDINEINKKEKTINDEFSRNLEKVDKIKKVKNLIIFNILYDSLKIDNDDNHFNEAYQELEDLKIIFNEPQKLNIPLSKIIQKTDTNKILNELIDYFHINVQTNKLSIEKLKLFLQSEKYLKNIQYINYFIKSTNTINTSQNKELIENLNKIEEYFENIKEYNYDKIINNLGKLKDLEIFDYNEKNDNYFVQFCEKFYNKETAISFLIRNDYDSARALQEKLDPSKILTIKDIENFIKCLDIFQKMKLTSTISFKQFIDNFRKEINDNKNKDIINIFENYCENYNSIIELDSSFEVSQSNFHRVKKILNNSQFLINYKNENFFYFDEEKKKEIKIKMEDLLEIRNDVFVKIEENNKNIFLKEFGEFTERLNNIVFFIKILRSKGCPIKLDLRIIIKNNKIEYSLKNKKKFQIENYEYIIDYLSRLKKEIETKYSEFYKNEKYKYIRYIYGEQFYLVIDHINGFCDIAPILEYCLNDSFINEGIKKYVKESEDIINYYDIIIKNMFENVSKYIENFFKNNSYSLEIGGKIPFHIIENGNFKGIYSYKCKVSSIEEQILYLYLNLTKNIPIAQNILKCNEETSYEEMFSFFHRAILCSFHTLFVVEINNSLSTIQNDSLCKIINHLLNFINKEKKEIKSLLLFVYQNEDHEVIRYLNKINIGKNNEIEDQISENINLSEFNDNKINTIIKNTKIFYSNVCGVGKSTYIKNKVQDKEYIYFPFGGYINKKIIFQNIQKILEKIKNPQKTIIHLDLYDTEQIYIMTDFLFSFLITKFYSNFENILSIPNDIQIYIEIPNEFTNFLDKFQILNFFIKINRTKEMKLNEVLSSYTESNSYPIINILEQIYNRENKNSDIDPKDLLYQYLNIKNPTFYQIEIFCKCIMSYNFQNLSDNEKNEFFEKSKKIINCITLFTQNPYSNFIIEENKKSLNLVNILTDIDNKVNNESNKDDIPLIFYTKSGFYELNKETINSFTSQNELLKELKKIMSIDNPIEENRANNNNHELKALKTILGNYVINSDNFIKMALIYYRINANIPVIIMGETGCGKTSLIQKLNEIKNNGESTLKKFNIHSGITEYDIIDKMKEINEEAKQKEEKIWVFFDEINTCKSMGILSEIFCKHSFNGNKLEQNILLIGACNPYRKSLKARIECGLEYNENKNNQSNELVYLVNPLPFNLMNFIFYFRNINEEHEKSYIESILSNNKFLDSDKEIKKKCINLIFFAHKFIRDNGDVSSVSLREINRFSLLVDFYKEYYNNKNEYFKEKKENNEINEEKEINLKCIVLGIYICYYIRLFNPDLRSEFEININKLLKEKNSNLDNKREFIEIFNNEKDFIISQIELEPGIGKNNILKENIFLMFTAINTRIPLIICGKPGCSKSLSFNLIFKSMKGKYSNHLFFRYYPLIIRSYFQGSINTSSKGVLNVFKIAKEKLDSYKEKTNKNDQLPISLIIFDELGLAEKSKDNPLKVLHANLDYDSCEREEIIGFIGISNWALDAAKVNRTIFLYVPELGTNIDDVKETMESIVKSINPLLLRKYEKLFNKLSDSFYFFKNYLRENYPKYYDIITSRDFYHLIKNCSNRINDIYNLSKNKKNKDIKEIVLTGCVKRAIERNFSVFELNNIDNIKSIDSKNGIKDSIMLFKRIYNEHKEENYKLININIKYEIIERIKDNLNDKKCRYLMLFTKLSMQSFILDNLLNKIENKIIIEKSPFNDENTTDYIIEIINKIKYSVTKGDTLILIDLSGIFDSLFDLFNQNWIKKGNKDYARICLGYFTDSLTIVNDKFKCIIISDINKKREQFNQEAPLMSRFEKHFITYENILNEDEIKIGKNIFENIKRFLRINIDNKKFIDYKKDEIIPNFDLEEILSLIHLYKDKKEKIEEDYLNIKICEKISQIFPQDIIASFNFSLEAKMSKYTSIIEDSYYKNEKISIIDYLIENKNRFSIIYTFSSINVQIKGDKENKIFITKLSFINSTKEFLCMLEKFYVDKRYKTFLIKFEAKKSQKIQNVILIIRNYEKSKNIISNNKQFIFTCHIKRKVEDEERNNILTISYVSDVNQKFIDNLNGSFPSEGKKKFNETYLSTTLNYNILDIFNNCKLEIIIPKYFKKFLKRKLEQKLYKITEIINGIKEDNYISSIYDWIKEEKYIIKKIIDIVLCQIKNKDISIKDYMIKDIFDKDKLKNNNNDLVSIIYKYSLEILEEYLERFFLITEKNNFITTIFMGSYNLNKIIKKEEKESSVDFLENLNKIIKKEDKETSKDDSTILRSDLSSELFLNNIQSDNILNNNENYLNKNKIIKETINSFFSIIDISDYENISKNISLNINLSYKLPGFYEIIEEMIKFINSNIIINFSINEQKLRYSLDKGELLEKLQMNYHNNENHFCKLTYNKLISFPLIQYILNSQRENENESELLEFKNLLLKDYFNSFLRKYYKEKNDYNYGIEYDIILLLLNIRYNEDNELVRNIIEEESSKITKVLKQFIISINWIESNRISIIDILIIYNKLSSNYINNNLLYTKMKKIIDNKEINYITQEGRNPEHTIEVNEAFYLILGSICNSITDLDIINDIMEKDNDFSYFDSLEYCINIFKKNNNRLLLFINQIYILSEFIEINKIFKINKKYEKDTFKEILGILKENSEIINNIKNSNYPIQDTELNNNIKKLYNIITEKITKEGIKYYELLVHIFLEEVKKLKNFTYRNYILNEFILKDNNLIIRSLEILEVLLINIITPKIIKHFLSRNSELNITIMKIINEEIKNNIFFNDIILYLFEKISNNYIDLNLNNPQQSNKENYYKESLNIFKESINYIEKNKSKKASPNDNIKLLFSIGYIKVYLYRFCQDLVSNSFNNAHFQEIINAINNNEINQNICSVIGLYYNKILYNLNGKNFTNFLDTNRQNLYKIKDFIFNKIHKKNYHEFYLKNYLLPEEEKMDLFDKGMGLFQHYQMINFIGCEEKFRELVNEDIDIFYIIISNLLISKLKYDDYRFNNKGYLNFGEKCENFLNNNVTKGLLNLFYSKNNFGNFISRFSISPNDNIIMLLYSLRFCIKIQNFENDNIYKNIFKENAFDLIKNNYYPGNDIRELNIYKVYSDIMDMLPRESDEIGCYICNCSPSGPYLHWIRSNDGFPTNKDKSFCKFCREKIKYQYFFTKKSTMIERKNYFRVFKDIDSLNIAKQNISQREGNFETIDSFWKKYVLIELMKEQRGILSISKNYFLKKNKCVRKLSQIGYRLLNFILFSNLLYSSALRYIDSIHIKSYYHEDMTCIRIMEKDWENLKEELMKKNVDDIEIFMNMIFKDITDLLGNINSIQNLNNLMEIEKRIEETIENKIINYNNYKVRYNNFNNKYKKDDICSIESLLSEKNDWNLYNKEKYPFLKYFYYTKYPNEKSIKSLIKDQEEKYPVINAYLNVDKREVGFLNILPLFNKFNNLLLDYYSFKITKINAEKKIFKNEQIYRDNKELCDNFIKFWNNQKTKEELKIEMPLKKFLLDNDNKDFINIYNSFIQIQNKILQPLIEQKVRNAIFKENDKEKIPIQKINDNEILTFTIGNEYKNFNNIILNNSKRNIYSSNNSINYNNYENYKIDLEKIENILTNILLYNKKLFSEHIEFINYKSDIYYNEIYPKFIEKKNQIELNEDDKKYISIYYSQNLNKALKECLLFLKEIKSLVIFIKENNIEENYINRIIDSSNKLKELSKIKDFFSNKVDDEFKLNKLYSIILFFEKILFEDIKNQLNPYQIELNEEQKKAISTYYSNENNKSININIINENEIYTISKEKISIALKRLITRYIIVLNILEEDIETVKESKENIVKYLYSPDLWDDWENLEKIKKILNKDFIPFNIGLNQALYFYEEVKCEKDKKDIFNLSNIKENPIINDFSNSFANDINSFNGINFGGGADDR